MKEIKLVHVSDVHLGSEFSSIPEKQEERQLIVMQKKPRTPRSTI